MGNERDFTVQQHFLGALEDLTEEEVEYYLALYLGTQRSHGFNRVAMNVDEEHVTANSHHEIRPMGRLDVYRDDNNASAKAVVGRQTLIGLPAKLGNEASVQTDLPSPLPRTNHQTPPAVRSGIPQPPRSQPDHQPPRPDHERGRR